MHVEGLMSCHGLEEVIQNWFVKKIVSIESVAEPEIYIKGVRLKDKIGNKKLI